MSSDSSDHTPSTNPIDVAVEGLVIRPDVFNSPRRGNDGDASLSVVQAHAAAAREKPDISSFSSLSALPLWSLLPIIGVAIAAGSMVSSDSLSFNPNIKGYDYVLTPPPGEDGPGQELNEYDPKIWLAKGKAEFSTVCASCHQPTGEGLAGQFPPLKNSEYVIHGETRVVAILFHGIIGSLQVNGKAYNGAMPAQGQLKSPKQIAQIASYIRNEWGNKASIIYDDQVAELKKTLVRNAPYTEAELKAIPQDANLPPSKHATDATAAAVPVATPAVPPATK